jgi:hypothetical protein
VLFDLLWGDDVDSDDVENKNARAASAIMTQVRNDPLLHGKVRAHAQAVNRVAQSLQTSMMGDYRPAMLKVTCDAGRVTAREAVSLGLIVTELIMNALKHGFADEGTDHRGRRNELEAFGRGLRDRGTGRRLCAGKSWGPASSTRSPNNSKPGLTL